jgi:hypothetical protein
MSFAVPMTASRVLETAHVAVLEAYKPFIGARNDAQGGACAWSPPV